jgi:uncharacterized protein (DUF2225 family)
MNPVKQGHKQTARLTKTQSNFVESENHCPLCGTKLEINVKSYLESYTLKEEAHCPSCDVKVRSKDHKMQ